MPFQIVRNDIANMQVDAVVNTANPMPLVGPGVDAAIHEKAGPELLAARKKIGKLAPGQCAVTPGFGLAAKYVIHTVGPVWKGGLLGEGRTLRKCYESALKLAQSHGCETVALPLISSGAYGFPRERAMKIALAAIGAYLLSSDLTVYLVVYDRESFRLSEELFSAVTAYIDDHYVGAKGYGIKLRSARIAEEREEWLQEDRCEAMRPMASIPIRPMAASMASKSLELTDVLKQTDAGFSETLLRLIDERGLKDSQVYKGANLSRQHFSKIRNDPDYRPKKPTVLACAVALKLNMEQTRDLLERAGFALTRASKFDLIVMYFLERGRYDIIEINTALFEFDQPLLGA